MMIATCHPTSPFARCRYQRDCCSVFFQSFASIASFARWCACRFCFTPFPPLFVVPCFELFRSVTAGFSVSAEIGCTDRTYVTRVYLESEIDANGQFEDLKRLKR